MTDKWKRCDKHAFNYPEGGYCPACRSKPHLKIIQIEVSGDDGNDLMALTADGRIFYGYWKSCGDFYWSSELTPDVNKLNRLPKLGAYSEDLATETPVEEKS